MAARKRRRRGAARRVGLGGIVAFLAAALAVAALLWLVWGRARPRDGAPRLAGEPASQPGAATGEVPRPAAATASARPDAVAGETAAGPEPLPAVPPAPASGAAVALVVDDLGRSVDDVRRLGRLGVPLTYAVLPFERLTPEVVAALAAADAEILVHLPMEGRDGADPGPGALAAGMAPGELAAATRAAIEAVPGAAGVNNHMGSVLSADVRAMRAILGEVAGRGLYFLDSRTTADTVGYGAARALGVPAARRDVFLDGRLEPVAIRRELRRALALAAERGSAIAIGHPHPETLAVLAEEVPAARELGYRFVTVGELLDRPGS